MTALHHFSLFSNSCPVFTVWLHILRELWLYLKKRWEEQIINFLFLTFTIMNNMKVKNKLKQQWTHLTGLALKRHFGARVQSPQRPCKESKRFLTLFVTPLRESNLRSTNRNLQKLLKSLHHCSGSCGGLRHVGSRTLCHASSQSSFRLGQRHWPSSGV